MLVSGVHHVSINVTDTARSLSYYRDLLGLLHLDRPAFGFDGAWLGLPDGRQLHLIETADVPPDLGQHLAFSVDDLDAVVEALRTAGFEVGSPKQVADTGVRQVFALDPDGNRVEFTRP